MKKYIIKVTIDYNFQEGKIVKKLFRTVIVTGLLCTMVMSGCKKADKFDPSSNAINIKNDNTIEEAAIGEFAESYYNESDLTTYINDSVTAYNDANGKDKIKVSSVKVKDNTAKIMMKYQTYEDYQSYNNETLFVGTVSDALKEGYDFNVNFISAESNENVAKDDVISNVDSKVIVVSESLDYLVDLPSSIVYYSDNAALNGKKEAKITKDSLTYIIYK